MSRRLTRWSFLCSEGKVLPLGKGLDLVQAEGAGFGFVLGDFFSFSLNGRVDGVVPEIQEEGPLVLVAD